MKLSPVPGPPPIPVFAVATNAAVAVPVSPQSFYRVVTTLTCNIRLTVDGSSACSSGDAIIVTAVPETWYTGAATKLCFFGSSSAASFVSVTPLLAW